MKNLIKSIKIIAFLLTVSLSINCSDDENGSKQPSIQWTRTFGGSKNEAANSVVKTFDGGYVVFGHTQSIDGDIVSKSNENFDYWILKFNADDVLEWSKTFGGSLDDRGKEIIQTRDGGYVVVGHSKSDDEDVSINAGSDDFWIIKLTSLGEISWEKSFGFSGSDKGYSLIQTTDGGYFVTGVLDVTASGGLGNRRSVMHAGGDFWAIKLDALGNSQFTKYFGGNLSETPYDCIQAEDNGFIIVGSSDSIDVDVTNNKGADDFWVVKLDALGVLVWEKSFGGSEIDEAYGVASSSDGNYLIVGNTRSNNVDVSQNKGAADLWLIKISPTGNLIWEKTFGGSSFDVGRSITKTQDNGFLIAGSSRSQDGDLSLNQGQNDAWFIKIDNNGNTQWQKTIGGSEIDFAYSVTELNNRNIIVVGETSSGDQDIIENKGFTDLLITKLR